MNDITKQAATLIKEIRHKVPLVHQITNYVTVNDCANITLAAGASPIMADDIGEAADIAAISSALVLNIGTLNERIVSSMLAAGKRANERGIPVVFDPVGAGASKLRNNTTQNILKEIKLAVLRGNLSEISFAAGFTANTRGVDASDTDAGNDSIAIARKAASDLGCVVAITGAVDCISDGAQTATVRNGHRMMSKVTGTGCMATALVGAYAGITNDYWTAAIAGIASMGIAGEIACEEAGDFGTGSYRVAIINAVSLLTERSFVLRAKIDEI